MSFEDTTEARKKRVEREAAVAERRGRMRNNSASAPCRGKKKRAKEVEEANCEINTLGLRKGCSVV